MTFTHTSIHANDDTDWTWSDLYSQGKFTATVRDCPGAATVTIHIDSADAAQRLINRLVEARDYMARMDERMRDDG